MNPTYITFFSACLVYVILIGLIVRNVTNGWGALQKSGGLDRNPTVVKRHLIYTGLTLVNSLVWMISGILSLIILLK